LDLALRAEIAEPLAKDERPVGDTNLKHRILASRELVLRPHAGVQLSSA
jgi:hypothetical protein